jgi:hypothetical protein
LGRSNWTEISTFFKYPPEFSALLEQISHVKADDRKKVGEISGKT